jgi:hypothetical protein
VPAFALRSVFPAERVRPRAVLRADVTAIREEFRSDHRLPAALMLLCMRVAGRPLDGFTVLPRNLPRYTAQVLGVSPPSLASLRSIYKCRQMPQNGLELDSRREERQNREVQIQLRLVILSRFDGAELAEQLSTPAYFSPLSPE